MKMDTLPNANQLRPSLSYSMEIRSMMFAFGDAPDPSEKSAELIEEVTEDQMNRIVFKAYELAADRGSKSIGMEEAIFLLRRQPVKVQRLIKYLSVKDTVEKVQSSESGQPDMTGEKGSRVKRVKEFLRRIDTNGMLIKASNEELNDESKMERLKRLDRVSATMDGKKYEEFAKARQVNFIGAKLKYQQKFHDWIVKGNDWLDMKIDRLALEIFSYLAYETVGQLVEMALLVQKETNDNVDPVERFRSTPVTFNPHFPMVNMNQVTQAKLTELESPLRKRLKSGNDETVAVKRKALTAEHVNEAVRRLGQMSGTAFSGGQLIDSRHQQLECQLPILAL